MERNFGHGEDAVAPPHPASTSGSPARGWSARTASAEHQQHGPAHGQPAHRHNDIEAPLQHRAVDGAAPRAAAPRQLARRPRWRRRGLADARLRRSSDDDHRRGLALTGSRRRETAGFGRGVR